MTDISESKCLSINSSLDELKAAATARSEELRIENHDIGSIAMYVEKLEILYEAECARRCYLEGYAEHLFTKVVCLDTK